MNVCSMYVMALHCGRHVHAVLHAFTRGFIVESFEQKMKGKNP